MSSEDPIADKIIDDAIRFVGVRETSRNAGPIVDEFTGYRAEPWCAHFVSFVYRKNGISIPNDVCPDYDTPNPNALVTTLEKSMSEFKSDGPVKGGLVTFEHNGQHHVGIVINFSDRHLWTVEGNSGDAVARRVYNLHPVRDLRIKNFYSIPSTKV